MDTIIEYFEESAKINTYIEDMCIYAKNGPFLSIFHIEDGLYRKMLHELAEKNGLHHVSYYDSKLSYMCGKKYWCDDCYKWLKSYEYSTNDWLIEYDTCENIVMDDDGDMDGSRSKSFITNNMIAITNDIELLKDIWIKKRD